jgi:hypothetical protein
MVDKPSVVLWRDIHEIADRVCKEFGLKYGKILPETRKQARHYGECRACDKCSNAEHIDERNCSDKILYIRTHRLNSRKPLTTSTILHTLAHELAHLDVWEHGKTHRALVEEITDYIRGLGYNVK